MYTIIRYFCSPPQSQPSYKESKQNGRRKEILPHHIPRFLADLGKKAPLATGSRKFTACLLRHWLDALALSSCIFYGWNSPWASPAVFFFRLTWPTVAGSTSGPDQVETWPFWYTKVELNGIFGGSKWGSMWCIEPKGKPRAPSWCGGGNFSLLLFAFACVSRRRLYF